jgi:hypothetical protein
MMRASGTLITPQCLHANRFAGDFVVNLPRARRYLLWYAPKPPSEQLPFMAPPPRPPRLPKGLGTNQRKLIDVCSKLRGDEVTAADPADTMTPILPIAMPLNPDFVRARVVRTRRGSASPASWRFA